MSTLRMLRLFLAIVGRRVEHPRNFPGVPVEYLYTHRLSPCEAWSLARGAERARRAIDAAWRWKETWRYE